MTFCFRLFIPTIYGNLTENIYSIILCHFFLHKKWLDCSEIFYDAALCIDHKSQLNHQITKFNAKILTITIESSDMEQMHYITMTMLNIQAFYPLMVHLLVYYTSMLIEIILNFISEHFLFFVIRY